MGEGVGDRRVGEEGERKRREKGVGRVFFLLRLGAKLSFHFSNILK